MAAAVKAVVLAQLHAHPLLQPRGGLDTEVYVQLARRAANGDWALGSDPYFVSPLYAYFLAVVLRLTGSLLAAQVVQVGLGTLAIALVFDAARRLYGRAAAATAAVLAALTGVLTFHEVLLLQSALDPFLTALGLALLARALQTGRLVHFGVAGLAVGVHALNRPNVVLWLLALAALLALTAGRRRAAVAVLLGGMAAIAPATLRNRAVSGEWILISSHGGLNLYIGNNDRADGTYRSVPGVTAQIQGQAEDARRVAEAAVGRPLSATETSRYFSGRAREWIRRQPARALALFLRKLAYTFNAVELPLNYSFAYYRDEERTALRLLPVGPWLLVPLGLLGLLAAPARIDARGAWTWKAFVPVYAVSVAAFFVAGRYRLALLVPLCVTSGAAAVYFVTAARERGVRALAPAVAALAALAVFANWNFGLDDGRGQEATEKVVSLIDEGRIDEARALIARTERRHPAPASLHQRAGTALLEAGRPAEALDELRAARAAGAPADAVEPALAAASAALAQASAAQAQAGAALAEASAARAQSDVALAEAREERGVALFQRGRFDEAAGELEAACALDPARASARLNLAVVRAQQGRYAEARTHVEEALRLRPDYPQAQGLRAALDRAAPPQKSR